VQLAMILDRACPLSLGEGTQGRDVRFGEPLGRQPGDRVLQCDACLGELAHACVRVEQVDRHRIDD
jgi:hypothetical protein